MRQRIVPWIVALLVVAGTAGLSEAGQPYAVYYGPQPYYVGPPVVAYQPVFATPPAVVVPTVVVQRPVVVAQPVVVAEPVFVETPVVVASPTPVVYSAAPYGTSYKYRPPVWPLTHYDKAEYRVHTPYGTHKYKYKTSWWTGRTRFDYDFDD